MQNDVLSWIAARAGNLRTPLYLYDEAALERSLALLRTLLPPDAEVFFSLKANPQPQLVRLLDALGARPEIASEGELHMCRVAGVDPERVLVGGVSKSVDYFKRLDAEGCLAVTIDSRAEWERLCRASSARRFQVLTRISPGIALGGLDMGGDSQFGLAVEDAVAIARECEQRGHDFLGMHLYLGSQRLKPEPIVKTVEIGITMLRRLRDAGLVPRVADIGLGCGIPYLARDVALDFVALADQLAPLWRDPVWNGTRLWTEAGRSLVAAAGHYITRVLETKTLHGKRFVFVDGGLQTHNPGIGLGKFLRSNPAFLFPGSHGEAAVGPAEIVGNLCTSADRLGSAVPAPDLHEGDLVVVPNAGAYCQTTGMWGFNSQHPFLEALRSRDGVITYVEPQYLPLYRAYPRVTAS